MRAGPSTGHVCVVLDDVADTVAIEAQGDQTGPDNEADPTAAITDLPWPEPTSWAEALRSSDAVTVREPDSGAATNGVDAALTRPLVFDGSRVYLERYWRYERQVGDLLLDQLDRHCDPIDDEVAIDTVLDQFFGTDDPDAPDLQRLGARMALTHRITVLAGGPGTGKTHTVARLLAALHQLGIDADRPLRVAMAAPTGKAAARMTEAVHQAVVSIDLPASSAQPLLDSEAGTIHRLLGYRDGISFRHDRTNPLPHDVVVIDETSMVALPLMARLLEARAPRRPESSSWATRSSWRASRPAPCWATSWVPPADSRRHSRRPAGRPHRGAAAEPTASPPIRPSPPWPRPCAPATPTRAIEVLSDSGSDDVRWVEPARLGRRSASCGAHGRLRGRRGGPRRAAWARPAMPSTGAADLKVLCGTRFGPQGSYAWRDHLEHQLPKACSMVMSTDRGYYVGRPVIITGNDYVTGVFNGDTGIVVRDDERTVVAMPGPDGVRVVPPSQLAAVETWWAMTIHKSQGSEFTHAVVSLP